jgi:methyl-accepting chemotaxis protein
MDQKFADLRVSTKLFMLMVVPLVAIAVISGAAIWALHEAKDVLGNTAEVGRRQAAVERVNGLVYAVVAESRGIYMANDAKALGKFADSLEKHLVAIEASLPELQGSPLPDVQATEMVAVHQIQQFLDLRRSLVATGRREGSAAARVIGDNDANRSTRQALNKALVELSGAVGNETDLLNARAESLNRDVVAILVGTCAVAFVLTVFLTVVTAWRAIVRPLHGFQRITSAIADGQLDVVLPQADRKDEIGDLARSLVKLRDKAAEARLLQQAEAATQSAARARSARLEAAVSSFERSIEAHLGEMAVELEQSGQAALAAADATLGNVRAVGKSAADLTVSILEVSAAAEQSRRQSNQTVAAAEGAVADVAKLREAADKAGGVVALIRAIAENTNLLALNATIEAARAGEAGKGFAVVAGEVKTLAEQTRKATDDVAGELERIRAASHASADAIRTLFDAVGQIGRAAGSVAATVEQQQAATGAIAQSIERVAQETQEVTTTVRGSNHAMAGRTSKVQDTIRQFLAEVRAA